MKWEYRMMRFNSDEPGYLVLRFGDLGREGWELVSVDNGIAYFKQPIQPKGEAGILAQLDEPFPYLIKSEDFADTLKETIANSVKRTHSEVPTKQAYDD